MEHTITTIVGFILGGLIGLVYGLQKIKKDKQDGK